MDGIGNIELAKASLGFVVSNSPNNHRLPMSTRPAIPGFLFTIRRRLTFVSARGAHK